MTAVLSPDLPRPIVTGENDVSIFIKAQLFDFIEHPPHVEVQFLDYITVKTAIGLPLKSAEAASLVCGMVCARYTKNGSFGSSPQRPMPHRCNAA